MYSKLELAALRPPSELELSRAAMHGDELILVRPVSDVLNEQFVPLTCKSFKRPNLVNAAIIAFFFFSVRSFFTPVCSKSPPPQLQDDFGQQTLGARRRLQTLIYSPWKALAAAARI
jgi:hypothetical protein